MPRTNGTYTAPTWVNEGAPAIDAAELQAMSDTIAANQNNKANLASPTFTGTPRAPTASAGTNTTQLATTAFVKTAVDAKVTYGATDLTAGTSALATGVFYAYYE